ncbi:hypothetical protein DSO57_1026513 [Entomophthora muscae]|uniref:Uncharacterized protein n=1 Tax=Entomophthora muscae TaxID=34485 RepID=A0ACC2RT24_9FUNG|nr:hypothetical protein DSO57_1026513 [Entomophthora muscae]
MGDFKDDEVPSLTEPEEIRCSQDKDQSLISLSSECCSKDEETEKDFQEAESVVFPISQVEKESLVEKIVIPPFSWPELLPPEDPGNKSHESSFIPLLALPHCKKDSKTELLHPDEMQEPQDLPLPTVALVSSIADELYDKLLVDQSLWEEEPTEIQSVFKKLSVDTKVKDGQLFKLYKDNWLSYVCLSLRTYSVVASHKATGHGGIQKTLAQLQKHCYWKLCLPSEVQEKYIIHIEEEVIHFTSMKLGLIITSAAFQVALDELKRTMMCASFLYLILLKTSVEHNILILTDMGCVLSQQEESSYELSISYCSEVPNFYERSYPMVRRERLPTEADPDEKIALYYSGNATQKEDCLSRLPVIDLFSFVHDEMHFNPLTDLSLWGEEIITAHYALENYLMSANVKDDFLFIEYKYLWIANICSSLQLDSVIVNQGPTGRVSIQRALSK